ncbi:hypothetical protein [Crocosphaera chwakensis]|uniref:Uncharacterized protein n=1 Tax=Crocosphaera chwakensis CCY0110 TaxID=391612 RepID=A3IWM4_9CHRO|nr:hypothetical protein [Crocosphaera chwakensis]EAZ89135.1 hypothetical protein CY0110_12087 [Crocosphaera chwakensis CCY0110]
MFNLKKLLSNPKLLSKLFWLLLLISFSIFCGFYIVQSYMNHEAISKIISWLIPFIVFIINIVLDWREMTNPNLLNETSDKPKNKLFSKQWYSENLWAIIMMIISISTMIILLIILTISGYWNITYIISDPKFDIINDWSFILLGIVGLLSSLERVERFKTILNNQFFRPLQIIISFSAFILYMIYTVNLTEVS